jgi:nitrate reductase NapAB chaperone NapD
MLQMMLERDEVLAGIVVRGRTMLIEKLIDQIENMRGVEVVYVRRAHPSSFLLVIETTRKGRESSNGGRR